MTKTEKELGQIFKALDKQMRQEKCPKCGRSLGGFVLILTRKTIGKVTGKTYKKGEILDPEDTGLCLCKPKSMVEK